MKTVFSNRHEVSHVWANQQQDFGKQSGGSLFFHSTTIYSYGYHFPIAKHVVNDSGRRAVLFTERSYSSTTAKHIAAVWGACSNDNIIYCHNPESTHRHNFESWLSDAESIHILLAKARKPEIYVAQLNEILAKAKRYAEFFSIEVPENLISAVDVASSDKLMAYIDNKEKILEAARIAEEQRREIIAKKEAKEAKKQLKKWLNFEVSYIYTRVNDRDYVRFNADKQRFETSQRIEIPYQIGKVFFEKLKNNTLTTDDRLLSYQVKEVGKVIRIGCHTFDLSYLLKEGAKVYGE